MLGQRVSEVILLLKVNKLTTDRHPSGLANSSWSYKFVKHLMKFRNTFSFPLICIEQVERLLIQSSQIATINL